MERRTIPFGYKYEHGHVIIDNLTSDIIKEVFSQYISGKSMVEITNLLNNLHIEYRSGVVGWNKARIKRILEEKRYLGNESFPQIIDEQMFERANEIKDTRNNQKNKNNDNIIYQLNAEVICPNCGIIMKRRHDPRTKIHERWKCQNAQCRKTIPIADDQLISEIHEYINFLIVNPNSIEQIIREDQVSMETIRIENEIGRMFDCLNTNMNEIIAKLLEAVSAKYNDIDTRKYEAQWLREMFQNQRPSKEFPLELFNRTISNISFDIGNNVIMTLINGQTIRRENTNGTAEEKSDSHRADDYRQRGCQEQIPSETCCSVLPGIYAAGRTNQQL